MLRGSAAGATQTHEAPVGSYQPTILKLIVIKLSRHKRYYLPIPYSIFPIEENVSSIIDKFKMNIVNCAMLSAFCLSMPQRPAVEKLTVYYRKSMMTGVMKWFCRRSGKKKLSEKDIRGMKMTAELKADDRNPYSWNAEFYDYGDGSGYEMRFTKCGICALMSELGLFDLVPAMCALDYTMSEAGGASDFVREYTLAGGGPYCDCGYKKK